MEQLKKISDYEYEIPKKGDMKVPGKIFISEKLLQNIDDKSLEQIKNVAKLPGIVKYSLAMPDVHQGYGFPIGGVAAFNLETGIISPGGVGYDINCGVRLLNTNLNYLEFQSKLREILHDIKRTIPSGVGRGTKKKHTIEEIKKVMIKGAEWALENGLATREDLEHTEENGKVSPANPEDVSQRAIGRGIGQLGTLGAGNHFIDILKIEELYNKEVAKAFGLQKDNIVILIHCGSRGLGHQIASDYIKAMEQKYGAKKFPDRELINAPINSNLGKKYLSAMNCAVNFAFCNRQIIMHKIRKIIQKHFPSSNPQLIYDVCHNIAKFEEHIVNGKRQKLCIHRKGATRCFGPENKEIPKSYRKIGQPVLIPGSMSTPSYILVGTKIAEEKTFGSTAHGAGRAHSRAWASKNLTKKQIEKILEEKNIILEGSFKGTIQEAEFSYKDPTEVVNTCDKAGIGKKVAKLKPIGVMIG